MNKKQNRVHIVVPVYNTPERLFRDCLRSIATQEHKDFVCILVDDGSGSETAAICDEAAADPRFTVIHKQNGGTAFARRDGVIAALSDGAEYISFIDSDDTVEPKYISMMLEKLLETNSDACFCGINFIRNGISTVSHWSPSGSGTSEDRHGMLLSVLDLPHKKFGTRFIVCAGLYRALLFDNVDWEFTNVKIGEDTRLSWQLTLNMRKAAFVRHGLYDYFQHQASVFNSSDSHERANTINGNRRAMIAFAKRRIPDFNETDFKKHAAFREAQSFFGLLDKLVESGINDTSSRNDANECVRHILHAIKTPGGVSCFLSGSRRQRIGLYVLNFAGLRAYRVYRWALRRMVRLKRVVCHDKHMKKGAQV